MVTSHDHRSLHARSTSCASSRRPGGGGLRLDHRPRHQHPTTTAAAAAAPAAAAPTLVGGKGSTCFWAYGGVGDDPLYNIAYPDAGATYWAAYYRRPAGSKLSLNGTYPHARYFSFISYDRAGQPVDGVADYQIRADAAAAPRRCRRCSGSPASRFFAPTARAMMCAPSGVTW